MYIYIYTVLYYENLYLQTCIKRIYFYLYIFMYVYIHINLH